MGSVEFTGPFTDQSIAEGDRLTIRADASTRADFIGEMGLEEVLLRHVSDDAFIDDTHTLLECTVPPDLRRGVDADQFGVPQPVQGHGARHPRGA